MVNKPVVSMNLKMHKLIWGKMYKYIVVLFTKMNIPLGTGNPCSKFSVSKLFLGHHLLIG